MKYLVNRETKEHRLHNYGEEHRLGSVHGKWEVVEADSEGWIPWSGDEVCPAPEAAAVWVRFFRTKGDSEYEADTAGGIAWDDPTITHYKPILTEQSKPTVKQSLTVDVFDRLRTATQSAASIPSIIAEIDELLGPDYQVVRVEKVEAQPVEDMSDWRNWKPGDEVLRVSGHIESTCHVGNLYKVIRVEEGRIWYRDESHSATFSSPSDNYFRFHSRPTGAAK